MRISECVWRQARWCPEQVAIQDDRRRVTYGELAHEVRGLCGYLRQLGVRPGDRIAVVSTNCIEYVELYLAVGELDATLVPVNWRLRPNEMAHILKDSEASLVFLSPKFEAALTSIRPELTPVREWITIGHEGPLPWNAVPETEAPLLTACDPHAVIIQMYTSGTTGAPRGAMLTHRNLRSMVASWLIEMPLQRGVDRSFPGTPLFHIGAVIIALCSLSSGSTLVLLPEFQPADAVTTLARHEITHALFVPAMLQWMLLESQIAELNFAHLKTIVYGAAPMPVPLLREAMSVFQCSFLQGYGLTESSGVLTALRPEDHRWPADEPPPARLASAGRALYGSEVRVVHPDGKSVAPGEVGEIVARGDSIMTGYFHMPDATASTLVDGWLHTGDLARIDEQGFIYIVDRQKDMIIVGGENVYPQEVEVVLHTHPAVADVAVIGIPNAVWGEEVLALIVLKSGMQPTDREIIQFCRQQLARYKCPTKVEFRDKIPRNAAGKILKRELRAPYWQQQTRLV